MSEQRFEKVVEWDYFTLWYAFVSIMLFSLGYVGGALWHHSLMYPTSLSVLITIIIIDLLMLYFIFNDRRVYWRKIK